MSRSLSEKHPLLIAVLACSLFFGNVTAQKLDSLLNAGEQWKLKHLVKGLSINAYLDAYYVGNIGGTIPTSHTYEFQTNSPFINEARLNMFDLLMTYTNSWSRVVAELRFGDQPMLLTASSAQWTSILHQAALGFHIYKGLWVDFGYIQSQMGVESDMPIENILSACTVGTYYEPQNILGGILSYTSEDSVWYFGIWAGNLFSLPQGKNIHVTYGMDMSCSPNAKLTLAYHNSMGNVAISGKPYYKFIAFNNLFATYDIRKNLSLISQVDWAFMKIGPQGQDTTNSAWMSSALLGARYYFLPKFAVSLRGEAFFDPREMFIRDKYTGKTSDFMIFGFSAGLEFNPGRNAYFRVQYSFLNTGDPGARPFNQVSFPDPIQNYYADFQRQCYTITTGIRF